MDRSGVPCKNCITHAACRNIYNGDAWKSLEELRTKCYKVHEYISIEKYLHSVRVGKAKKIFKVLKWRFVSWKKYYASKM